MATFLTYLLIIVVLSIAAAFKLSTNEKERGELFIGAFCGIASLFAIVEAISFMVDALAMFLFDFKPTSSIHVLLIAFWFYNLFIILNHVFNKDTK
ncbi:hypothetical protein ACNDC9_000927 [Shigella sonnei]|uniref:hypothetical protein n=1 Tax=Escherichia coli TaxID=562 RepID=UPI000BEA1703|nr:hypothetical protein [Escherichia coli]